MAGTAPNYDDIRWPAKGGLRLPQEAYPATLAIYGETDLKTVAGGTIILTPIQAGSSLISITPTANTTLVFPGPICQAGKSVMIANLAAITFTVTCQIAGNLTNVAVVPPNTVQLVVQTGYNNGMALVA